MKNIRNLTLLFLLTVFAFLIRSIFLDKFPPSPNWDEISHGYSAYSILKTGSDEWGKFFPIVNFRAYGDYPLPLNLYLTIPYIFFLGLNTISIRLPHAVLGALTVIASYYLAFGLTKSRKQSLLAAFLVAIEPWTFFTSRMVLQQNLSIFFLTLSGAFWLNRSKSNKFIAFSYLSLFLTLFSYHSTRIFSPLLLCSLFVIHFKDLITFYRNKKIIFWKITVSVILFLIVSTAIILQPAARARSQWLFIINQSAVNRIIEARQNSRLPQNISKIINNRPIFFITQFSKNYLEYFSPEFLFLRGGTQHQYSLPGFGLLYLVNLPFFYIGILILLNRSLKGDRNYMFILFWLLLSPIPGSITNEHFAVTRASVMLPLPQVITAIGVFVVAYKFFRKSEINKNTDSLKYIYYVIYFIILLFCLEKYMIFYFSEYPKKYSQSWQYGYKETVGFALSNYDKYDKIIYTKKYGEPHEFVLFYSSWNPGNYKNDKNLNRYNQSGWYWVDSFDKFYFVNDWQIPKDGEKFVLESKVNVNCEDERCLLLTSPGNYPSGWKMLKTVNFLDNTPAFEIYEN